jgi:hypothetical protein
VTKETEFFGTPWQEQGIQRMVAQSPLTHADRVRTPTLLTVATPVLDEDQVTPKSGSVNPPAVSCWVELVPVKENVGLSIDGTAGSMIRSSM